jgi:site-specific DNA-methyltransferase (adenine-specific)
VTPAPYYADNHVQLYLGDMREVLPALGITADAVVTDPPYGETSLAWDRWVDGWPALVADCASRLWCFGTLGMFMDHAGEFSEWRKPRSIVWEKNNGTGFAADFFRTVHELAGYFYRGAWANAHEPPRREPGNGRVGSVRASHAVVTHTGKIGATHYVDDGKRLVRSVLRAGSIRGGLHPTEKPAAILAPLIEYAVPPGGLVLDPFGGSCSTGLTARQLGRRAVVIEANEEYCEKAAERLSVPDLFGGVAS